MAPVQNISNTNVQNSPKKSKKKNKKNRHSSEKEEEVKIQNEQEKEVCVEKVVVPGETLIESKASPPRQLCPSKHSPPTDVSVVQPQLKEACPIKQSPLKEILPAKQTLANEIYPVKQTNQVCSAKSTPRELCSSKQTPSSEIQIKNTEISNNESKDEKIESYDLDLNLNNIESEQKGGVTQSSLASEVAKARQLIKNSLQCMDSVAALAGTPNVEVMNKINSLEKENKDLKKTVEELSKSLQSLKVDFETFTAKFSGAQSSAPAAKPAEKPVAAATKEDSDDGVDLFGSDDEEESAEAARIREERLAAYNAKKSNKPVLIAKSNIILDVKPWDDETDMKQMEAAVREISTDGLLWGAAKLVPLAYGIHKLQISCVVEDDKVSIDWLTEELEKIEDYVQSVDIAAFNKV